MHLNTDLNVNFNRFQLQRNFIEIEQQRVMTRLTRIALIFQLNGGSCVMVVFSSWNFHVARCVRDGETSAPKWGVSA